MKYVIWASLLQCNPTFVHNFGKCLGRIQFYHRTLNTLLFFLPWEMRNTKNSKFLVYLTQQRRFSSNFHKINKQNRYGWMEQTKCQKGRLITRIPAHGRLRHSSWRVSVSWRNSLTTLCFKPGMHNTPPVGRMRPTKAKIRHARPRGKCVYCGTQLFLTELWQTGLTICFQHICWENIFKPVCHNSVRNISA